MVPQFHFPHIFVHLPMTFDALYCFGCVCYRLGFNRRQHSGILLLWQQGCPLSSSLSFLFLVKVTICVSMESITSTIFSFTTIARSSAYPRQRKSLADSSSSSSSTTTIEASVFLFMGSPLPVLPPGGLHLLWMNLSSRLAFTHLQSVSPTPFLANAFTSRCVAALLPKKVAISIT